MNSDDEPTVPEAIVLKRDIPKVTKDAGLPTAQSRVDIYQSKVVVVPALQEAKDHEREAPRFVKVSDPWTRAEKVMLVLTFIFALVAALAIYFAR